MSISCGSSKKKSAVFTQVMATRGSPIQGVQAPTSTNGSYISMWRPTNPRNGERVGQKEDGDSSHEMNKAAVNTEEIWKEFSDRLRRFILTRVQDEHNAEDILQDIFCKIHSNVANLRDKTQLRAWVYQITRNTIIDYYRYRKGTVELPETFEIIEEPVARADATNEVALCLEPMIDHLPKKYRQAIILAEFEGLTQKEMGEKLGLSPSGAKSRVQRARARLKDMLLAYCHFEFDRLGNILDYQPKEKTCRYCAGDLTGSDFASFSPNLRP